MSDSTSLLERAYNGVYSPQPDDADRQKAKIHKVSLVYGELTEAGVRKAFSTSYLNISRAHVLVDLGSGFGKLVIQAFLEHPQLTRVVGIEFSTVRAEAARLAMLQLGNAMQVAVHESEHLTQIELSNGRLLQMVHGDLHDYGNIVSLADVVVLQTRFVEDRYPSARATLQKVKKGARLMSYKQLEAFYDNERANFQPSWQKQPSCGPIETTWNKSFQFQFYTRK